jgi:hypothetical protein
MLQKRGSVFASSLTTGPLNMMRRNMLTPHSLRSSRFNGAQTALSITKITKWRRGVKEGLGDAVAVLDAETGAAEARRRW